MLNGVGLMAKIAMAGMLRAAVCFVFAAVFAKSAAHAVLYGIDHVVAEFFAFQHQVHKHGA